MQRSEGQCPCGKHSEGVDCAICEGHVCWEHVLPDYYDHHDRTTSAVCLACYGMYDRRGHWPTILARIAENDAIADGIMREIGVA